jgi:uncharacterized protein (UPF0332 family)
MDGKLFLRTACLLRDKGSDEAAYRSAMSRAYYACFLEARKVAFNNCDPNVRKRGKIYNEGRIGHEPLSWYLKQSSNFTIKMLGSDLANLHGVRKDADYNMSKSIAIEDAVDAIDNANDFLSNLSSVSPSEIGKAMEDYYRLKNTICDD